MGNSNPIVDLQHCDFVPITRALTGLTANLAKCELACEAHKQLLDQLDEEHRTWVGNLEFEDTKWLKEDAKLLMKRSGEVRRWMQALKARTKYLTRRSQAYVQTVYSLMAQKDNALNMQTAEASLRISQAAYRDSSTMIILAEDSKQVALATSRDSSSMFIISALTLVFLPPTFTATLFSTEFFDLKSTNMESIASSRFWLYWAVTIPLTVITAASAAYFWKMRDKKLREAFTWQGNQLPKLKA
ncbi:hypothetical protein N0V90_009326 [Kalmusia sp. IMI 367209]|nr:hypothetical protein N0V90_009326 [Kalmusia sp. IMI 367209]